MKSHMLARGLAVALALSIASPVAAQESATADEADVEFRLGNEAFLKGDYDRALSHYFASNRLVPNLNVLYNVARAYEASGRLVEAYRYYQAYLPAAESKEQQEVIKAIKRIRKGVAVITINTEPSGATVFLDRKDLGAYGVTPIEVPVRPGEYQVIVEKPGYEEAKNESFKVSAGDATNVDFKLLRREGTIALRGRTGKVTVRIGDESPREIELPATIKVPVGAQLLEFSAPGYSTQRIELDVLENETIQADVQLERQRGAVVVQSSEANSAVLLDGEVVGFAPTVIQAPVGKHVLSVRSQGFGVFAQEIEVTADGRLEVNADLEPVSEVAAASRVAERVRDAPASVSLVSSREIEAMAYTGSSDALVGLPGVFYTNDRVYDAVGMRGYGPQGTYGNRVVVQIDGHTINDNWVDASYHQFEILTDLYSFDRLEVVKGPNSVLYGSGAFQGVIGIVSPELNDTYVPSRVGVSGVMNDGARAYAHLRKPFEDGGIAISAGVVGSPGDDVLSPSQVGSEAYPDGIARGLGGFDGYTLRANVQKGNFKLLTFYHERDKQSPLGAFSTIFGDDRTREADARGFADARYRVKLTPTVELEGKATLDYYGYEGDYAYEIEDGGLLTDRFAGMWTGGEARLNLRPFEGAYWSISAELLRHFLHNTTSADEVDGELFDIDAPFWKTSAAATLRQDVGSSVSIWAGARYDLWLFDSLPTLEGGEASKQISNVNPRLVVITHPWETGTIKLMFGRGFRAPSVYELIYKSVTQLPAPNLTPEIIYSGELEFSQDLPENFTFVVNGFVNRIDNRIERTGAETEEDPLQFQNVDGELWSGGGEFELRRPFLRGWMGAGQYSIQSTRTGELGNLFSKRGEVFNSPTHMGSVRVVAPVVERYLNLGNRVRFEAGRLDRNGENLDPAVLWDVALTGALKTIPFKYAFRVQNALDWNYEHPADDENEDTAIRQPGRTFVVDIAAEF